MFQIQMLLGIEIHNQAQTEFKFCLKITIKNLQIFKITIKL